MIPKLHYISQGNSPKEHLENIQLACSAGAELVQFGFRNNSEKKLLQLAHEAREITAPFQTRLVINDHYKIAKEVKADGVQLGISSTSHAVARKYLYTWQLIGGTANTLQECEALVSKEVDYISLAPFRLTTTGDNDPTVLGLDGYTAIIEALKTETPILGAGGITPEDVKALLEAGISGIAVSDAITADFNTIRTFHQLLNASTTAEQRYTFE